jgi:hypothetical protein
MVYAYAHLPLNKIYEYSSKIFPSPFFLAYLACRLLFMLTWSTRTVISISHLSCDLIVWLYIPLHLLCDILLLLILISVIFLPEYLYTLYCFHCSTYRIFSAWKLGLESRKFQ